MAVTGGSMGGMALFSKPAISVTALKPPTQTLVGSNVNRRTLDGTLTQTLVGLAQDHPGAGVRQMQRVRLLTKQRAPESMALMNFRRALGLTLDKFAGLIHVSRTTAARWETSHPPGSKALLRLAREANYRGRFDFAEQFLALHRQQVERDIRAAAPQDWGWQ